MILSAMINFTILNYVLVKCNPQKHNFLAVEFLFYAKGLVLLARIMGDTFTVENMKLTD